MKSITSAWPILLCIAGLMMSTRADCAENKIGLYFEESFGSEAAGKYDAALNSVLKILRADQRNYLATLRAGWLNHLRGDQGAAERFYRKSIELAPGAVEPRLGLLLPLMADQKWTEAEAAARAALNLDGKNYTAGSKLAYVLFQQGRYEEARNMYRSVLDNYPSDVEMKLGLAWSCQRLGKKEEAGRYFREVLEVYKGNVSAMQGLEMLERPK